MSNIFKAPVDWLGTTFLYKKEDNKLTVHYPNGDNFCKCPIHEEHCPDENYVNKYGPCPFFNIKCKEHVKQYGIQANPDYLIYYSNNPDEVSPCAFCQYKKSECKDIGAIAFLKKPFFDKEDISFFDEKGEVINFEFIGAHTISGYEKKINELKEKIKTIDQSLEFYKSSLTKVEEFIEKNKSSTNTEIASALVRAYNQLNGIKLEIIRYNEQRRIAMEELKESKKRKKELEEEREKITIRSEKLRNEKRHIREVEEKIKQTKKDIGQFTEAIEMIKLKEVDLDSLEQYENYREESIEELKNYEKELIELERQYKEDEEFERREESLEEEAKKQKLKMLMKKQEEIIEEIEREKRREREEKEREVIRRRKEMEKKTPEQVEKRKKMDELTKPALEEEAKKQRKKHVSKEEEKEEPEPEERKKGKSIFDKLRKEQQKKKELEESRKGPREKPEPPKAIPEPFKEPEPVKKSRKVEHNEKLYKSAVIKMIKEARFKESDKQYKFKSEGEIYIKYVKSSDTENIPEGNLISSRITFYGTSKGSDIYESKKSEVISNNKAADRGLAKKILHSEFKRYSIDSKMIDVNDYKAEIKQSRNPKIEIYNVEFIETYVDSKTFSDALDEYSSRIIKQYKIKKPDDDKRFLIDAYKHLSILSVLTVDSINRIHGLKIFHGNLDDETILFDQKSGGVVAIENHTALFSNFMNKDWIRTRAKDKKDNIIFLRFADFFILCYNLKVKYDKVGMGISKRLGFQLNDKNFFHLLFGSIYLELARIILVNKDYLNSFSLGSVSVNMMLSNIHKLAEVRVSKKENYIDFKFDEQGGTNQVEKLNNYMIESIKNINGNQKFETNPAVYRTVVEALNGHNGTQLILSDKLYEEHLEV